MIKLSEQNNLDHNDSYVVSLIKTICRNNKLFLNNRNYSFDEEIHMGTICLTFKVNRTNVFWIYCTPFYDGANGISIDAQNSDDDVFDHKVLKFSITNNIKTDVNNYYKIMENYVKNLVAS